MRISQLIHLCNAHRIPTVNFRSTYFESIEQIRSLADQPSEMGETSYREGVVLVSDKNPDKMAKCIGFEYLTSKGKGKKKRTERH